MALLNLTRSEAVDYYNIGLYEHTGEKVTTNADANKVPLKIQGKR